MIDVAWAAGDFLLVAADRLDDNELRLASRIFQRVARPPYGRTPPPSLIGSRLRAVARYLAHLDLAGSRDDRKVLQLLAVLFDLLDTLETIRTIQQQTFHARLTAAAAGHVHTAHLAAKRRAVAGFGHSSGADVTEFPIGVDVRAGRGAGVRRPAPGRRPGPSPPRRPGR
jgi:hypothetical protein